MSRRLKIPLAEYDEMTPFEMNVCAELYAETIETDQENGLFLAYVNAYWQRVDPLKSFDEMLGREAKPVMMSAEEMLKNAMGLNMAMGGSVDPSLTERG